MRSGAANPNTEAKGKSLAYVLGLIARAIEGGELEERIDALEARVDEQQR